MAWEYADLFDVTPEVNRQITAEYQSQSQLSLFDRQVIGDVLKNERTAVRVGQMGYRTKTTIAGPRLEAEVYPIFGRNTEAMLRRAKKTNITPEKQQRLNHERSIRHLVMLTDANFNESDIHLTLTYQTAPSYERAKKDMRNFMLRVKRIREKRGMPELKYIYTIEGNEDGGRERIHIHCLMNGDMNREELEQIWQKGYANADRLKPDENGLEAIARYLVKQQKNKRKWCASKNLKQPKSRTSDSKCSNARVKRIAFDMRNEAQAEMEKLYPGYRFVKCSIHYSDIVDGAYIRCVMRRKENGNAKRAKNQKRSKDHEKVHETAAGPAA